MKRFLILALALSLVLLCACTHRSEEADTSASTHLSKDIETSEGTSEGTSESTEHTTAPITGTANSAVAALDLQFYVYGRAAVIVPEYDGAPTDSWLEDDAEGFYIVPMEIGSLVELYEIVVTHDGEYIFADTPTHSLRAQDGCILYAELVRPTDAPKWGLRVSADGHSVDFPLTAPDECGIESIVFEDMPRPLYAKPVIYLYPETEVEVSVKLDYKGDLTCTYPTYQDGWTVTAQPDGTLTDADGKVYNYLYWEGEHNTQFDFSQGFCVAGADTAEFLEGALEQLGLTRREANEFIVFWLPMMQNNPYNIIAFQTDVYTENAPLEITPTPDSLLRVFMAWYPSETTVDIASQTLTAPERAGFTVVEWGGSQRS